MRCGLLGERLGHSYSPQIHARLGSYSYSLYEKPPEELALFLKSGDFTGLNVTIPYKKAVIPYCTELSDRAKRLGAVNTIVRRADGSLIGHNTDFFGFSAMVRKSGLQPTGKKCLVLGSGGASATAVAVLEELGGNVIVISRSGENSYKNLSRHGDAAIIVNATPVGMYPNTGVSPVNLDVFPHLEGVLDLIYNPARTALLQQAGARGLVAENGLWMLVAQAKESAEWFTGRHLNNALIAAIHAELKRQMENIILIGMPGSGKSTVAAALAEKTGERVLDADAAIVEKAEMSIPDIFARHGEAGFRALETEVLGLLGKQSGCIISTGGGCVTRQENYPLLHQNGTIFCLERDLTKLPTDGRPLSQGGSLMQMYQVRKPLYDQFADYRIDNNGALEETVNKILSALEGTL